MEEGTFSDGQIIDLVDAYFIPAKVKTTSGEVYETAKGVFSAQKLARSFGIRGVPATYFLKPDGTIITNVPGYVPVDNFSLILKYLGEEHYLSISFEEYKNSLP
jgi:thioredoxin-related protein